MRISLNRGLYRKLGFIRTVEYGERCAKGKDLTADNFSRAERIRTALESVFTPDALTVTDTSYLHEGHAGARPGGETHYRVEITAQAFVGLSRIERHRAINAALQPEFDTGLHALEIKAKVP